MFDVLRVLWRLRGGSSYSVYRTLRDTLIKKQESYARGQYLNRKVLEPFLEACDDTLPNQNSAHHDLSK